MEIKKAVEYLLNNKKPIMVISHHDTDGISSAAIISRVLQRLHKPFTLKIVKGLEKEFIQSLPDSHFLFFLDLASASLEYLAEKKTQVLVLDHHEISSKIPENVLMVNPWIEKEENICGAAVCYLFGKQISEQNKDLAHLAVLGMVGDMHEKVPAYESILRDADVVVKNGLLLYPATRPLDRALESSTSLYIPQVTGSYKGVMDLLREAGIEKTARGYKSLAELDEKEMSRLITSVMLRKVGDAQAAQLIGPIYLIKWYSKLEDARELSASINACSRMDHPEIALGLCLGNVEFAKQAEKLYIKYKQNISSALQELNTMDKIAGKNYTIINAQDRVKDTIIGTLASIMSFSPLYPEGTIIVAMAYNQDKIKVSARIAGRKGRNVREVLSKAVIPLSGEVGGHPNAAGCLISKEQETEFITNLKQILDIDFVKV